MDVSKTVRGVADLGHWCNHQLNTSKTAAPEVWQDVLGQNNETH